MADAHVRVPDSLAEAARSASGLGPDAPVAAVAWWAMASASGWPAEAAQLAAGITRSDGQAETDGAQA